jgi:hypothetical protein
MRLKREPQIRIGHCCGCRALKDQALFQVRPDVWRCSFCYKKETGYWHWLTPRAEIPDA